MALSLSLFVSSESKGADAAGCFEAACGAEAMGLGADAARSGELVSSPGCATEGDGDLEPWFAKPVLVVGGGVSV